MLSNSNEFYLKIKSVVSHYYMEVLRRKKNVLNKALKYLNDFFFGKKEIADQRDIGRTRSENNKGALKCHTGYGVFLFILHVLSP